MSANWINSENMLRELKERMNEELMAAADPIIKKAVEDAEKEMRKRLASMFVALIDQNFSIERHGYDLRILVQRENGLKP